MSIADPPRLDYEQIDQIRRSRGGSLLLFITDRCPVGCAHCSVDSRRDSPTISDFALFGEIVDWICAQPALQLVGISGGEPFVERRGLAHATRRIVEADKRLVVYTSGVWATRRSPPRWISEVLSRCDTVFLSTDAFHAEQLADARYIAAARAIAAAGAWIVVQVIDDEPMVQTAETLLTAALGERFEDHAELRRVPRLAVGRGADVFAASEHRTAGHAFAPCQALASPVIRYDGVVAACCNERVIMEFGPKRLRGRAGSHAELDRAMNDFGADPLLRAIGAIGPGALTRHPKFAELADEQFANICNVCWKMLRRAERDPGPDPLLDLVNSVLIGRQ
jgi:organic radical activating enzyme